MSQLLAETCNAMTKNGPHIEICNRPLEPRHRDHDSGRFQWTDDAIYLGSTDRVAE